MSLRPALQLLLLLLLLGGAVYLANRPAPVVATVMSGPTMGTTYTVKLHPLAPTAVPALKTRLETILQTRIIDTLSTYHDHSVISRFNASQSTDWQPIPLEVYTVLTAALGTWMRTDGAFDVTVGPLVDVWGFGRQSGPPRRPSAEELAAIRDYVGSDKLELRADEPNQRFELRKRDPRVRINVSAIVPGYAVDLLAAELDAQGIPNYLIDIGGELFARGVSDRGGPWRVAIEQPKALEQRVQQLITLPSGYSAATSGNYRNYTEIDGQRYTHLIDPATGQALPPDELASVTVIATDAMTADALSTGLMVRGLTAAKALAEQQYAAAFFIHRGERNDWRTSHSPAFAPFLVP